MKSDNMATYINKKLIYSSELGEFFLGRCAPPNYAINAKSPLIVVDIETNIATFFNRPLRGGNVHGAQRPFPLIKIFN